MRNRQNPPSSLPPAIAVVSTAAGDDEGDFWDVDGGGGHVYVLESGALLRMDLLLGVLRRLQGGEAVVVARARNVCRSWRAVLSDPLVDAARRLQRRQEKPPPPPRRSSRRAKGDGIPPPRHGRRPRRKPAEFRVVCR